MTKVEIVLGAGLGYGVETNKFENRGETTRRETTRGETSWGETSFYLGGRFDLGAF